MLGGWLDSKLGACRHGSLGTARTARTAKTAKTTKTARNQDPSGVGNVGYPNLPSFVCGVLEASDQHSRGPRYL